MAKVKLRLARSVTVIGLAAVVVLGGCAAVPAPTSPPVTPRSTDAVATRPSADLFAGLPYSMVLPPGWTGGGPDTFAAEIDRLRSFNPGLLERIEQMSPPAENAFVGIEPSGDLRVAVVTLELEAGPSNAEILAEAERQNVEGIGALPGTIGTPSSERVHLPAGDAVRIAWLSELDFGAGLVPLRSVGYALPSGRRLYTIVFSYDEGQSREAEMEQIVESFQVR